MGHEQTEHIRARVETPLEKVQDGGLASAPRRVDANSDRIQVGAGNDRLDDIDDIDDIDDVLEPEKVDVARIVVAQRHGRMRFGFAHESVLIARSGGLAGAHLIDAILSAARDSEASRSART